MDDKDEIINTEKKILQQTEVNSSSKVEIIKKESTENNSSCFGEKSYLNIQDNNTKDKQTLKSAKNVSVEIESDKELLEHDKEQFEEVELIVEEIIEIEESVEPIEICDEIETLEIEHSEDNEEWTNQSGKVSEPSKICKFQNENNFKETELESCQLFQKQTQQLKTYGNRKKLISQSQNETKKFILQKTQSVHNFDSPNLSTNLMHFENDHANPEITLSNDSINTSCNLDSNIYDDNIRKDLNDSKSKIKIIKNQILNEAIDIKSLLKLKKTDKKIVKHVENRLSSKSACIEEKLVSKIESNEKLRIYEKPSVNKATVLEKPKIMEKVLWKNVSIGNEKKLIPISTAVKIVKIPKNAKVVKVERSKETDRNINLTNIPIKYSNSSTFIKSSNLKKISNVEMKVNDCNKNIKDSEFDNMVNKPNKSLKVYSPTKSFIKSHEDDTSPELIDKVCQNEIHQKSKDDKKILPQENLLINESNLDKTSFCNSSLKINISDSSIENKEDVIPLLKKRRGRPPKKRISEENSQSNSSRNESFTFSSDDDYSMEYDDTVPSVKKRRGRPPKKETSKENYQSNSPGSKNFAVISEDDYSTEHNDKISEKSVNSIGIQKKRRGRPPKLKTPIFATSIKNDDSDKSELSQELYQKDKDFEDQSILNNSSSGSNDFKSPLEVKKLRGRPSKRQLLSSTEKLSAEINNFEDLKDKDIKSADYTAQIQKKRRGRPPRIRENITPDKTEDSDFSESEKDNSIIVQKKRRGRPPQNPQKKRRGRPPKNRESLELTDADKKVQLTVSKLINENSFTGTKTMIEEPDSQILSEESSNDPKTTGEESETKKTIVESLTGSQTMIEESLTDSKVMIKETKKIREKVLTDCEIISKESLESETMIEKSPTDPKTTIKESLTDSETVIQESESKKMIEKTLTNCKIITKGSSDFKTMVEESSTDSKTIIEESQSKKIREETLADSKRISTESSTDSKTMIKKSESKIITKESPTGFKTMIEDSDLKKISEETLIDTKIISKESLIDSKTFIEEFSNDPKMMMKESDSKKIFEVTLTDSKLMDEESLTSSKMVTEDSLTEKGKVGDELR